MTEIELWESEIEESSKSCFFEDLDNKINYLTESIYLDSKLLDIIDINESIVESAKQKILSALRAIKEFFKKLIGKIKESIVKFRKKDKEIEEKVKNNSKDEETSEDDKWKKQLEQYVKENSPIYVISDFVVAFNITPDLLLIKDALKENHKLRWVDEDYEKLIEKYDKPKEEILNYTFHNKTYDEDLLKYKDNIMKFVVENKECTNALDKIKKFSEDISETIFDFEQAMPRKNKQDKYEKEDFEIMRKVVHILNCMKTFIGVVIAEAYKTKRAIEYYFICCGVN